MNLFTASCEVLYTIYVLVPVADLPHGLGGWAQVLPDGARGRLTDVAGQVTNTVPCLSSLADLGEARGCSTNTSVIH